MELFVGVAGFKRRHCSFGQGGVAHEGVAVAVAVGGRDAVAGDGTHAVTAGSAARTHVLGAHVSAEVDFCSADVGVGVNTSRQDKHAAAVDDLRVL